MKAAKEAQPPPQVPAGIIPTKATMQHGDYDLARIEKNGPKVAINRTASPLRLMLARGSLSAWQCDAGEQFEAIHRLTFGSPGVDAIAKAMVLGIVVRGTGNTEAELYRRIRSDELLDRIRHRCHPMAYSCLVSVAVQGEYLGPNRGNGALGYVRLWQALDICADVLGIGTTGN